MSSHLIAEIASRVWGLKDRDYSPLLAGNAKKELALDRDSLDKLILTRIKAIIKHAHKTSLYYSKVFADHDISPEDIKSLDDIKPFPCLTRDILREKLPELASGGAISSVWRKSATGGTTSSPVTFYCDEKALWQKNAFTKAIDSWYGRNTGDQVAYLWGASQDIANVTTLGMRLRNISYQHSLMLPSAPLDDHILAAHYKKLSQWRPSFIQAYPTPLYELCLYMQKNSLQLPTLKAVSVTAETLYPHHRKLMEETFGLRLYNWYGSRELGRVASECEYHNGMHINEPSVFVEIEPDPSLPDGCGHLIITDLWNRAVPFIRYRTGDMARFMTEECPCGRSLKKIELLEGRVTELIILRDGKKIRYTNKLNCNEIKEIQIVQKSYEDFLVRFVKGSGFSTASLPDFTKTFNSVVGETMRIAFEEVLEIPRERSGKVRLIVSEL